MKERRVTRKSNVSMDAAAKGFIFFKKALKKCVWLILLTSFGKSWNESRCASELTLGPRHQRDALLTHREPRTAQKLTQLLLLFISRELWTHHLVRQVTLFNYIQPSRRTTAQVRSFLNPTLETQLAALKHFYNEGAQGLNFRFFYLLFLFFCGGGSLVGLLECLSIGLMIMCY